MRDTPLTLDERARLPEFIMHWARIGLSAQPIEHSAAERAIAALYAWAGLPKPRIVWAPCPMTALLSLILYSRLRHRGGADGSTIALALDRFAEPALDAAVPVEAHRQIRIAVEQAVAEALACVEALNGGWPAVAIDLARRRMLGVYAGAVSLPLRVSLRQLLMQPVRQRVRPLSALLLPTLRTAVEVGLSRHADPACFGAPRWLGTAALLDYLDRVLGLPLDRRFLDTVEGCGLFWPRDGLCFAAERPSYFNWDEAGQLHCAVGPSVAYPSGWSWWHRHGVPLPQQVIEAPERITPEAIRQAAPAARRVMLEHYRAGEPVAGIAAYLRDSGARLLDHDPDFGKLWRIDTDPAVPMLMLEVENRTPEPDGAYQHFLLRVDPELRPLRRGGFGKWQHPTARNAVASTFGLTGAEYGPQVES